MDYLLLAKYKSKVFLVGFSSDYQEINDIYMSIVQDSPFDYYLISKDLINLK